MDETSKVIIDSITIHYQEPRQLEDGKQVTTFFDCRALTPNDLARLAAIAVGHLEDSQFDLAVGVAYSGILFAAAVAAGQGVAIYQKDGKFCGSSLAGKKVVIVDDVIHSGAHVLAAAQGAVQLGATVVGFACVVDRSSSNLVTVPEVSKTPLPIWSAWQAELA